MLGGLGCASGAAARPEPPSALPTVETDELAVPLPDGYRDITSQFPAGTIVLVLAANEPSKGYQPTITVLKPPVAGGSFADAATCAETGRGLVAGGTEDPGTGGSLKGTRIIDGPVGRACQIHLVAPEGVAIITELHRSPNTPQSPQDLWLMTCNHADGDARAEAICRSTLAGFRFRR